MTDSPITAEPVTPGSGSRATSNLVLILLCLAQFMLVLDISVVSVALPAIQEHLGFQGGDLQWVVSAYAITFGGFLLLMGRVGDLFGRRRMFLIGVGVFTAASAACGAAGSPGVLMAARAVQGVGAAMVSPAALSLLTTSFAEGPARNRALGVWGAVAAAGAAAGVLLGGILTDTAGWRWIFLINIPVGVLVIVSTPRLIPAGRPTSRERFDVAGAVFITTSIAALVYAFSRVEGSGARSVPVLGSFGVALVALAAFVATERRSAAPLIHLSIFRSRQLSAANTVELIVSAAIVGQAFFGSLYLQRVLGFSAIQTGLAFLPTTVLVMVSATLAPKLLARRGIKTVVLIGTLGLAGALALLSRAPVDGSYAKDFLPGLAIFGLALGATFTGALVGATTGVREQDQGVASGIVNTAEQIGTSLGIAVLASVAASRTTAAVDAGSPALTALNAGYGRAFLVAAGFALVALIVALVAYPNPSTPRS